MSRAEESPEASIEEILASIRKTFADEPQSQAPATPSPVAAPSTSRPSFFPSFRSAADAPAASHSVPLPTPPASRAAAIDADLADLIDRPAGNAGGAQPIATPASATPASASPVEAAREKWANLLNPGQPVAAPAVRPVDAPAPRAETPPAPQSPAQNLTGLFAPRKGGFYPPQEPRSEPVLPMPSPSSASPEPAQPPESPEPPESTVPAAEASEPATARAGFIATATSLSAGPAHAPPVDPLPAPAEVPAASARALDDLVAGLNNAAATPAEPAAATPAPVSAVFEPPASRIVSTLLTPAPVAPSSEPSRAPAPASADAAASAPAPANRTLEDAVADMLRPMLEKWIDENMPRIVERALQRDASLTGKKVN